jgi:hypothetical protein
MVWTVNSFYFLIVGSSQLCVPYDFAPAHFIIGCSLFDIGYSISWLRLQAALYVSLSSMVNDTDYDYEHEASRDVQDLAVLPQYQETPGELSVRLLPDCP